MVNLSKLQYHAKHQERTSCQLKTLHSRFTKHTKHTTLAHITDSGQGLWEQLSASILSVQFSCGLRTVLNTKRGF